MGGCILIRKINFLVIVLFVTLFILIVNAAEEENKNPVNETSNLGISNNTLVNEDLKVDSTAIKQDTIIEDSIPNNKEEKERKTVTSSFGIYLQIVS